MKPKLVRKKKKKKKRAIENERRLSDIIEGINGWSIESYGVTRKKITD